MIIYILLSYLLVRIYPYIWSYIPLGYDPGLYLYLWRNNLSISWLKTIYPPLIFYIGKFLSMFVNPENFLIPISVVISLLLFWSIYLYTKNRWTLFLLTVSAIQFKFWWWYYIKNILATSFIFFYLYLDKQKSKYKYIFPIVLPWLHQPTSIIFFIVLMLQKNFKSMGLFLMSFAIYYLPNYSETIAPYFYASISTIGTESGTFYNLVEALKLMWPYLPMSVYGMYLSIKNKSNRLVVLMTLISFLIPLFGLFLSRRFIPFFDLFVIILAGYGCIHLFSKKLLLSTIYIVICIMFLLNFVSKNSEPLIQKDEYAEIKLLSKTKDNSYVLVTDNEYTPWIYGYSNRKPITPGFGEFDIYWTNSEWNDFWLGNNRETEIELLKKLPKPLYIFAGDKQRQIKFVPEGKCFERYSWHVWEFVCN